jgi:hypothetical protein
MNHERAKNENTKEQPNSKNHKLEQQRLFRVFVFRTTVAPNSSLPAKNCWRLLWKSSAVQHLITKERKNENTKKASGSMGTRACS